MNAVRHHWQTIQAALAAERTRALGLVRTDEVSFLPAAMEIVERPVSPTGRATAWVLLIGFAATMLWLVFGSIDIVASAQGRLIPADYVKLVQPAEAGQVRAILVHDGQSVRRGQPLIELDPTVSTAEATQAQRALESAQLDAARARAVLSALDGHGVAFSAPSGTSPLMAAAQAALARSEYADIAATLATHRANHVAAAAARASAGVQADKLTETLPLLDEQIAANEQLLAKGFVSKLKVLEMRRQRLSAARDRDSALQSALQAEAQAAAARSSVAQAEADGRARILTELTKSEAEARLRSEELVKARQRSSLQRLLSPVDGTVTQLAVHTVGGIVEPTKPLMVIVPSGGPLVGEVKILNRDVGFVRRGQPVAVKLEAFPFTRYGTVAGIISSISSDAVQDDQLGLIYTARVNLGARALRGEAARVRLTPGMAITADIRTGRRTIGSYLMSPIQQAGGDAARER